MRVSTVFPAIALLVFGASMAAPTAADESMIPVNKGTTPAGDGQAVMFKGSPLPLAGKAIKVGEPLHR